MMANYIKNYVTPKSGNLDHEYIIRGSHKAEPTQHSKGLHQSQYVMLVHP